MVPTKLAWKRAVGGAFAAEVLLVAAAFLWVAVYSHLIAPGQDLSVYRQYAQSASPWVSVCVGIPLFYLLGRWLKSPQAALLLFACVVALDLALIAAVPAPTQGAVPWGLIALSYATKLLSLMTGARQR